jgi:hypothetical protein
MMQAHDGAITMAWRFTTVVVPTVLVLGVLNALPQFLGGDPLGVVRYGSVEDAEARLGVTLYRPAVLHGAWRWPPSRVRFAAGETGWVEFVLDALPGSGADSLVLCQTLGPAPGDAQVPTVLLASAQLLQASDISIVGRVLRMQRLLLDDGALVHELWWREGTRRVMLRARVPADSLLRMAPALLGNR